MLANQQFYQHEIFSIPNPHPCIYVGLKFKVHGAIFQNETSCFAWRIIPPKIWISNFYFDWPNHLDVEAILSSAFAYTLLCNYNYGYHNEGRGCWYKRPLGNIWQTWVAKSASWFNGPLFYAKFGIWMSRFSKFPQIWTKISSNFRIFEKIGSFLSFWSKLCPKSGQLEMLLIPNALCWSSWKCNCACALPAEVQLRLCVTRRSWQKLFVGKNFVKILVTAQTQLRSYSEQQRAFGNSNICSWCMNGLPFLQKLVYDIWIHFSNSQQHVHTKTKVEYPQDHNYMYSHFQKCLPKEDISAIKFHKWLWEKYKLAFDIKVSKSLKKKKKKSGKNRSRPFNHEL